MKKVIVILIVGVFVYLILGTVLPFAIHPDITEETKKQVEALEFEQETASEERAMILAENGQALEERIRMIAQAKERIVLSTFDFRTDESGKDMLASLLAAAKRGVHVQVLVDGLSALTNMSGNEYFCALSAMENVQIQVYSPINVLTPWKLMGRMHDKYLLVDDNTYITGGRNTFDFFLGSHNGYKNYDWDVLVYHTGQGQSASMRQMLEYFEKVWSLPECKLYHDKEKELTKPSVLRASEELQERYAALQKEHPDWFTPCDYIEKTKPTNGITLLTNPTSRYSKEPVVFYAITQLMEKAEKEVRFHTPYIICNDWMLKRLKGVCDKAPKVTMMTNSVANNGNLFGAMDYQSNRDKILATGVQILEYDSGVSYHGKCFTIDNHLSGIGSFNWDMRSAYIDTEMMLLIDSEEINAELQSMMTQYEKEAIPVPVDESYLLSHQVKPQEVRLSKKVLLTLLRLVAGWARFLM